MHVGMWFLLHSGLPASHCVKKYAGEGGWGQRPSWWGVSECRQGVACVCVCVMWL